ncbi:MAG: cytosolic protein [Candidatus Lokiarchaeota archaeon]|nr:cytosolic protein [Candidatus Lokiarchaeota archaeon]
MVKCNQDRLKSICACTYTSCSRRGRCCECIDYHLSMNELPGCVFAKISKDAEKTYNRSFKCFAKLVLNQ